MVNSPRRRQTGIPAVLIVLFVGLTAVSWHGHVAGLDRRLTADLVTKPSTWSFRIGQAFSLLGSGPVVLLGALTTAVVVWRKVRDLATAAVIPFTGLIAGVGELAAKRVVARPRPVTAAFTGESGFGFPSGHTTGFAATAFVAAVIVGTTVVPARKRHLVATAVVLACLVAIGRVVVGAHYVFDVAAGLVAGAICTTMALWLLRAVQRSSWTPPVLARRP